MVACRMQCQTSICWLPCWRCPLLSLGIYLLHHELMLDNISLLQLTAQAVLWLAGCGAGQVSAGCHAGAVLLEPGHVRAAAWRAALEGCAAVHFADWRGWTHVTTTADAHAVSQQVWAES